MTAESSGDVFDVKQIRRLIELMKKHDLSEIDLKQADQRVRIKRGGDEEPRVSTAVAPRAAEPAPALAAEPKADDSRHAVVTSPMVGTFYRASGPESAPFIKVGDVITEGQTVMLIEAMKTYNPVRATTGGKVLQILVGDSTPVEFGEELLLVE